MSHNLVLRALSTRINGFEQYISKNFETASIQTASIVPFLTETAIFNASDLEVVCRV